METKDKEEKEARGNVYLESVDSMDLPIIKGYDFNKGLDYGELFKTYINTGFQATCLG